MDRIFYRKAYDELATWKKSMAGRYAALIEGARRVGKTTIAEDFARKSYRSYIKIDFSNIPGDVIRLFDDINDLDMFFLRLQAETGIKLYRRDSAIISYHKMIVVVRQFDLV